MLILLELFRDSLEIQIGGLEQQGGFENFQEITNRVEIVIQYSMVLHDFHILYIFISIFFKYKPCCASSCIDFSTV